MHIGVECKKLRSPSFHSCLFLLLLPPSSIFACIKSPVAPKQSTQADWKYARNVPGLHSLLLYRNVVQDCSYRGSTATRKQFDEKTEQDMAKLVLVALPDAASHVENNTSTPHVLSQTTKETVSNSDPPSTSYLHSTSTKSHFLKTQSLHIPPLFTP